MNLNSKDYLLNEAERLYVYDCNSIDEIASKVKISTRTLFRWKLKHDWDTKRREYLKSKHSFHEEMYEFARKLMNGIMKDIEAGEKVDQGRMYTFCKMIPMFTKVKDYEDTINKKSEKEKPKGLTPDIIAQIEQDILGIPIQENGNENN